MIISGFINLISSLFLKPSLRFQAFEKQNDQLVLQKKIAEDLRSFLDVDEGIRCMIYGKPIKIKADKADFYIAYMHQELEPKTAENQLDSM